MRTDNRGRKTDGTKEIVNGELTIKTCDREEKVDILILKENLLPFHYRLTKGRQWDSLWVMKHLSWDLKKNEILKAKRGISFEEIAYLIESGQILGIEQNPGFPNQNLYVMEIDDYAVVVPFVESEDNIFLKTAFPSRKYTKLYKLKGK